MLGACASPLDKSDAMQMCFASGSAEKKAVSELPVSGTLPCHGTFGLFRIQLRSGGNGRERKGTVRQERSKHMPGAICGVFWVIGGTDGRIRVASGKARTTTGCASAATQAAAVTA